MNMPVGKNIDTILSNNGGRCIELLYRTTDPLAWIVQTSKKFLWFRLNRSRVWFEDKEQALRFAEKQAMEKLPSK